MTNKKKKNRREYTRYVGQFKMVEHIVETLKGENKIGAEKKKKERIHNGQELSKIKEVPNYSFRKLREHQAK